MILDDEEKAMLAGEAGTVAKIAIEHQIAVGDFFAAHDFVPVTQAHIMADTESLGQAGVMWLERPAAANASGRMRIPTITDPRGTDFAKAAKGPTAAPPPTSSSISARPWPASDRSRCSIPSG